jgi:ABC-2 type transport system permease protein
VSALAGVVIVIAGSAAFGAPVLLAIRADEPWILPASFAALGAAGLVLYRIALPRAARLLAARREPLLEVVCGDDA